MAVDRCIFGINLLTAIISSLFTLLVGWLIAWFLIHKYQKRNIEIQNKNKIIEEIATFKISLQETTDAWFRCKQDEKNSDLWYVSRTKLLDTSTKREILYVKILNQYPDYLYREFTFKDKNNVEQNFKLKNMAVSFREYTTEMTDSLNTQDYRPDISKNISEKAKEVSLYLSYVLLEIIREPLSKEIKKYIAGLNG